MSNNYAKSEMETAASFQCLELQKSVFLGNERDQFCEVLLTASAIYTLRYADGCVDQMFAVVINDRNCSMVYNNAEFYLQLVVLPVNVRTAASTGTTCIIASKHCDVKEFHFF